MIAPVMPVYSRTDVQFERGEGAYLFDTEGRRFLDFTAGIAVNALGHAHPHLVEKLTEQAQKLWHTSNLYRVPGQESLAKRLTDNSFADTVFFTNSGAEAWEGAVKLIRKYHTATGHPERFRIITIEGAFHGRTMTGIAASKAEKMVKGFGPLIDGFDQVPFGNMNELRAAIGPHTAAINVEPIIGEGGIKVWPAEQLRELREIADEFGLLLFYDEIQCGMGRTGKLFYHEWADAKPDVMCIAKALGGGFPVGAFLATEKAAVGMTAGTHGSTFGGNPLAMAVGNAVMDVMLEPGFLDGVDRIARILHRKLGEVASRQDKVIAEIRGAGLMIGIKCQPEIQSGKLGEALFKAGLLTVGAADNVVRLLPPLIIEESHVEEAVGLIDKACTELAA